MRKSYERAFTSALGQVQFVQKVENRLIILTYSRLCLLTEKLCYLFTSTRSTSPCDTYR